MSSPSIRDNRCTCAKCRLHSRSHNVDHPLLSRGRLTSSQSGHHGLHFVVTVAQIYSSQSPGNEVHSISVRHHNNFIRTRKVLYIMEKHGTNYLGRINNSKSSYLLTQSCGYSRVFKVHLSPLILVGRVLIFLFQAVK